ncbi:delta5 fatty acid desaturase [Catenaria anguillulae PL171]|uniref:Delta5 fatty acid desaturase n=1 Tax=Catenaria anguillulae PL171 TaxID=765915 RepID=A0A1Y2HCU6_9FUNG|nr:delta5 fatty acid desaturase [Catenaria anguillulae PL171]
MPAKLNPASKPSPASARDLPSTGRLITTAELATHNTPASCWLAVRGKVYDVTSFLDRHPGGRDLLLFAAGRDATQVFETYHQFKVQGTLPKYLIGDLADNELPVFPAPSPFFVAVKERVYEHLRTNVTSDPKWAVGMWVRYAGIYSMVVAAWYAQLWVWPQGGWAQWLAAVVLGFFCAQIGLNPLHDASHFAVTHSPWVWKLLGATHDYLNGASYVVWIYQHMLGHHPYTNIPNADPDIATNEPDVRRIKAVQPWYKHYLHQEWFVPVLYGVLSIKTRIQDVTILYTLKKNDNIRINPLTAWHEAVFWSGKAFFVFYRLVVPVVFAGLSVGRTLALFLVADLVSSYWLALTFQANHVVEETKWPEPNERNEMSIDWAEMQVATTQDYAHDSAFWTIATGSLNYQAVHHLFPEISQYYYPMIAPVIMKTCQEFGVKYLVQRTFWDALGSHLKYLKVLGLNTHEEDLKKKEAKAQ